jgi:hypothetical protein
VLKLQREFSKEYRKLMEEGFTGERHSTKIMAKLKEKKDEIDLVSVPDVKGAEPNSGKCLNTFPTA